MKIELELDGDCISVSTTVVLRFKERTQRAAVLVVDEFGREKHARLFDREPTPADELGVIMDYLQTKLL